MASSGPAPAVRPAPHATAGEPHPDDARAESGGGCRSCFLLAAICALLTLLAGVAFLALVRDDAVGLFESFQRQEAAEDLALLADALESWADGHGGRLPDSLDDLDVPAEWLLDRWQRPIRYAPAADRRSARLTSLGADNTPGGEGGDADLDRVVVAP